MRVRDARVPLTVVTGFLGAGKTTLINRLLRRPDMAGAAVVVNEFGAVGIDHVLVERAGESVVLLASGCVCCAVLDDFRLALRDLFMRSMRREVPPLTRVVLETSGLADPGPIGPSLVADAFLAQRFRMHAIVTVADATSIERQCEEHPEALRQLAAADLVVLGKTDAAAEARIEGACACIAMLAPGAPQLRSVHGDVDPAVLLAAGSPRASADADGLARWLPLARGPHADGIARSRPVGSSRHSSGVWSSVLTIDRPVSWAATAAGVDELLERHGDSILRIKGLVNAAGRRGPLLLDCVGRSRHPAVELDAWPADGAFADGRSRLVFIARAIAPGIVADALRSLGGHWSIAG